VDNKNNTKAKKKIMSLCMWSVMGPLDAKDYNLTIMYKNPDLSLEINEKMGLQTSGIHMVTSNK
jgi:uncharacterized protein YjaZ